MISPIVVKKRGRRSLLKSVFLVIIIILIAASVYLDSLLDIITGYAAKNLASGVFVSERTQEDMEENDLNFSFIALTKNKVNRQEATVTSRFLWGRSVAVYRDGFGVTLVRGTEPEVLKETVFPQLKKPAYDKDTIPWPTGDILPEALPAGIDPESLSRISEDLFVNKTYGGNAYAFMVLKDGLPVAERYREGFSSETKFLSWSMGKSVTNAIAGVMSGKGLIDIYEPAGLDYWANDERKEITYNDLMQMQSGLAWNEDYGNRSDVTVMLHEESDFASFAYEQDAEYEHGTYWYYSSGTTNIVSYLMRSVFENDSAYYIFPYEELFYKIGITDAVFEPDASGTFVGSSYLYMTARDFARFALLYQQDGVFDGQRILPEGWVEYTRTPASASEGQYGSFFWLNSSGRYPSAPGDMYMCIGHDGQRIFIMPSQNIIVVVLGYSPDHSMDFDKLLADILACAEE